MSTPIPPATDVIVVGGGITGLTAAYAARKQGLTATVFEAASHPGGLIGTDRIGGFTIEAGPDSLLAQKADALDLCEELGISSGLQSTRPPGGAFVLKGRRLYPLPSPSRLGLPLGWDALLHYRLLPPLARARLALEPWIRARRDDRDESVGSFFRRRFGSATVNLIAQPLLGGIHAGDVEQLSMRALFPKLRELERTQGHVLTLGASPERRRAAFVAPRDGMSVLVQALADSLGDALVVGRAIRRVERKDDRWIVCGDEDAVLAIGRSLVLAVPAFAAADLLAPLDAEAAAACREIPYVSTAGVALAWPRADVRHPLSGSGFVVARRYSTVRITACTWVSSKWDHRAPADAVLMRAFLGGVHDPGVVDLDDSALVEIVSRDLEVTLGITALPMLTRVYRWRRGSVQHNVGQLARVGAIEARLAAHPGLFIAGAGFRAVGIPDCIADARAAVQRILHSRSES